MTSTMVQLPQALETLIESRLDTIDRMLVGRVPRQDRLAIVREVESQIYDLLQEGGARGAHPRVGPRGARAPRPARSLSH